MTLGSGTPAAAPGAPPQGGGGGGGGRGRGGANANLPPIERNVYINPKGGVERILPARRAYAELPRLHQVAPEACRRHGDRVLRRAALPPGTRGAQGRQGARLGRGLEEEQDAVGAPRFQLPLSCFQFPPGSWELVAGSWELSFNNPRIPSRPHRARLHGQGPFERLLPGRALLRSPLQDPAQGDLRPRRRSARRDGRPLGLGRNLHRLARDDRRADIDAVDISLPNHMHASAAIAAAEAGKIVMCEKPLAITIEDARAMARAAKQGADDGLVTTTGASPPIAFARQLIDDGRLGPVFHYNAVYKQQWGADTSRPLRWKMDPAPGSGVGGQRARSRTLLDTALYLNGPMTERPWRSDEISPRTGPWTTPSWRWSSSRTAAPGRSRRPASRSGARTRTPSRSTPPAACSGSTWNA